MNRMCDKNSMMVLGTMASVQQLYTSIDGDEREKRKRRVVTVLYPLDLAGCKRVNGQAAVRHRHIKQGQQSRASQLVTKMSG